MSNPTTPRVVRLADQLEAEIVEQGLQPGDTYLVTAQVASQLRISNTLANRVMQLLASRGRIVRRQGRGTFVADRATERSAGVQRVHLLVREDFLHREGLGADGLLVGLQRALPVAEMQFNYVPDGGDAEYVGHLVDEALRTPLRDGFVLIRSSLEVQRLFRESELPAVVFGALYPSIQGLPGINRDMDQIGRILAEYLLELGSRRLVVLMREKMLPGDFPTLDAVQRSLGEAGLPPQALILRTLPPDEEAIAETVAGILRESDEPTGLICRSVVLARGAEQGLERAAAGTGQVRDLALCDWYARPGEKPRFTYARPALEPHEVGERIGKMLLERARDGGGEAEGVMIPVTLERGGSPLGGSGR